MINMNKKQWFLSIQMCFTNIKALFLYVNKLVQKEYFKKAHLPNDTITIFKKFNIYVKQFLILEKGVLLHRLYADNFNISFNIINFFKEHK